MSTEQIVIAAVGWSATAALLVSYLLLSTRRLAGDSIAYQVLNVYGALGLMVAAWAGGVWPAVALNLIWALIGAVTLARILHSGRQRLAAQPADPTPH